jgi:hypothetical protein
MVVPLIAACRIGFSAQPDGQLADAPPADTPVIPLPVDAAAPAVLACGATKFAMVKAPTRIAATATADGYNVIISDGTEVRGFTYQFDGDKLGATLDAQLGNVLLFTSEPGGQLGEITTIANGDHSLVAVTSGPPPALRGTSPAGILPDTPLFDTTTLLALDAKLDKLTPPAAHKDWVGGIGSLARNRGGTIAFLGTLVSSSEIDARVVASDGTMLGSPHAVVPSGSSSPTIVPAGDEFLVVWNAYTDTSAKVFASLHRMTSDSLVTRVPAKIVSSETVNEAFNPRAAHLAATGTSLITWVQKPGDPLDHIWISVRDRELASIATMEIGRGNFPVVVAGERDFLVVWRIDAMQLGAKRVTPDGVVHDVAFNNDTTHEALGMDLVVRAGQPALVWIENGDSGGATVRFDPLCMQ